jgi:hypothetical protein
MAAFGSVWRRLHPEFVAYFQNNYVNVYARWVRACYLEGREESAFRIPTTTSGNEGYHSHLKADDLDGWCARPG